MSPLKPLHGPSFVPPQEKAAFSFSWSLGELAICSFQPQWMKPETFSQLPPSPSPALSSVNLAQPSGGDKCLLRSQGLVSGALGRNYLGLKGWSSPRGGRILLPAWLICTSNKTQQIFWSRNFDHRNETTLGSTSAVRTRRIGKFRDQKGT